MVAGVMPASWQSLMVPFRPVGRGWRGAGCRRAVEGERVCWSGGDEVSALVDEHVVVGAQADQVFQAGPAAVDPVLDVVQVDPAGLTAGEPAAAVVAVAGGPAQRGARPPAAPAGVQDGAVAVVQQPAQGGGAGDHLRGADADRGAVLDVAAGRVGRVTGRPAGRRCFRGNGREVSCCRPSCPAS